MRATASTMVEASPTARAQRDAGRDASRERWWAKFSRKAPDQESTGGRLDALQTRARDRAAEEARWNNMLKEGGYTGPKLRLDQIRK